MSHEVCDGQRSVEVTSSTSWNPAHPPMHAADGRSDTFWVSTGMFPQELTVALPETCMLKRVELVSQNIRSLEVSVCHAKNWDAQWERLCVQRDVDDADGQLQRLSPNIGQETKAAYLRIKVLAGYADIISIFKVCVTGTPVPPGNPADGKNITPAFNASPVPGVGGGSLASRMAMGGAGDSTYNGSPKHRK